MESRVRELIFSLLFKWNTSKVVPPILPASFRPAHRPEHRELWFGRIPPLLPQAVADAPHLHQRNLIVHTLATVRRIHPWDVWGPGNVRVVPRRTVAYETVTGMQALCGMRALSDHIIKDRDSRLVISVYDLSWEGRKDACRAAAGHRYR